MKTNAITAAARLVLPVVLAVGGWLVGTPLPTPLGLDAPATVFSAARADATLGRLLGSQRPHSVSTPENAAVRDRVIAEFAALGVVARVERGRGCHGWPKFDIFVCGTTENLVAPIVPGDGPAIVLLAHYDSVPAGPGAGDDLSGVAAVLETVRALKAAGLKGRHPVFALITDGEEAGMLGAAQFLSDPRAKASVGAVVNVEARGNQGPSLLFQTSPGDGPLISLYGRAAPNPASSSLANLIYKQLPNDTDLTPFIAAGITAFNFAFSNNVAHYHTPLDRRENLSPATLQHQGDNLLSVVAALLDCELGALAGPDAIYLSVAGLMPRLPASAAPPLAALTLLAVLAAAYLSRADASTLRARLMALAMPLIVLVGSIGFGWLLHTVAAKVSGHADPSFAHPDALRIALGLGVVAVAVLCSRLAGARLTALSVWAWLAAIGAVTAALLPGLSPYFLFPALIATPLVLVQARRADAWSGAGGTAALFLAAIPAVLIWMSLARTFESVQGLVLHPAFTLPVAIAALALLPMIAGAEVGRRAWLVTGLGLGGLAVVTAGLAGLQPAYSAEAPQRLNVGWIDDHVAGKGRWSVETSGVLPASMRSAAAFSPAPELAWPVAFSKSFVAEAGPTRFPAPTAEVTSVPEAQGRRVTLGLHGSNNLDRLIVVVPNGSGLTRVEVDGRPYVPKKGILELAGTIIGCATRDCDGAKVTLVFDSLRPVDAWLVEQRYELPADGAALVAARPAEATVNQWGDTTVVFGKVSLP